MPTWMDYLQKHKASFLVWLFTAALTLLILFLLFEIKDRLIEERISQSKSLVETVISVVASAHQEGIKRRLGPEEAKEQALKRLVILKYGKTNYFWINNLDKIMVMHPVQPELVGRNLSGVLDAEGESVINLILNVIETQGEGVISYLWPKPNSEESELKMSYVKLFPEWEWVIGSGVYIDDVNEEFFKYVVVYLVFLIVVIFPVAFVVHRALRASEPKN